MILQLCDTKLDLVPVYGIHWVEGCIRDEKVITGLSVDNNVKSRSHVRGHNKAKSDHVAEDVWGILPARVQYDVLSQDDPVKVIQRKAGLDMEHHILANIDLFGAAVNKDMLVTGGIGSPGDGLCHHIPILISVTKVSNYLKLLNFLWNIKLKYKLIISFSY